jgi:hypothetical protein
MTDTPIHNVTTEEGRSEMAAALAEQRESQGSGLSQYAHDRDSHPTLADQTDPEVRPMVWKGEPLEEKSAHKAIETASEAMSDFRRMRSPVSKYSMAVHDAKPDELRENWKNRDLVASYVGHEHAAQTQRTGEVPPIKSSLVNREGQTLRPLDDDEKVEWEHQSPKSVKEATRWKARGATQDAIFQQAVDEAALAKRQEAEAAQAPAPDAAVSSSSPQSPPAQQATAPTQPDPAVVAERQRLHHEAQRAQLVQQHALMSDQEREAYAQVQQLDAWATQNQDLQDERKMRDLIDRAQRGDVKAREYLETMNQVFRARQEAVARFELLNQHRVQAEQALARDTQAQRAQAQQAFNLRQDEIFRERFEARRREHSGPDYKAVRDEASAMMIERYMASAPGVTREAAEQAIRRDWEAGRWRSVLEQETIAEAAELRLIRKNLDARRDRGGGYASVVRPGVSNPGAGVNRGSDNADRIRAIQRQLETTTSTRQSLRLGAELTRLQRDAGQIRSF